MSVSAERSQTNSNSTDARLQRLTSWVAEIFGDGSSQIAPASADASFRRYFRITRGEQTWIAMDAPPEKEDLRPYISIAGMLNEIGVNAPRILERNIPEGYLLNTDLGSRTYLAELARPERAPQLYADAMRALVRIQAGGRGHANQLPAYDAQLLHREMRLFTDWFCARHLGLEVSAKDERHVQATFDTLAASARGQTQVFVHRDYHSRNLMVGDGARYGANPGILDFQDAVDGPITYDLVSLLRDCYVAWPVEQVRAGALSFRSQARAAGLEVGTSEGQFLEWFDLMGVQRHLKAIGIFARLWHRDGKSGYLKDIPRTLNYVHTVAASYPQLTFLRDFITARILPIADRITATQA
ncbi:MAG TPA: phosphotransferase [Steroidobacteraceae bacterium]|nr:phosphotransferase [Steroidobacteraceae bacterium]